MKRRLLGASFPLALALMATAAPAATLEYGAVARGFFTAHGRFGNFYGVETRLLRSGPAFLGLSGFGGPVLNAPRSALGYGGVLAGVEVELPLGLLVTSRLWLGGGGGSLEDQRLAAFSLEPSVSIGLPIAERVRGSLSFGTLTMLGVENLNGLVIAFRAEM